MSLAKKISNDVKSALKGGDKKKLSIARYVYSELKNFLIKENLDRDVLKLSDENINIKNLLPIVSAKNKTFIKCKQINEKYKSRLNKMKEKNIVKKKKKYKKNNNV